MTNWVVRVRCDESLHNFLVERYYMCVFTINHKSI